MPAVYVNNELREKIKEFYLSKPMSLETAAKEFNLSYVTIQKILKSVPKYPRNKIFNPNLKEDFFHTIDSEEKAYFLGLIISDGNVFKDENHKGKLASISITLDLKDEYMLKKFGEVTGVSTTVGHDGRGCGQLAIRSNIMAEDLAQWGVIPRKTLLTYLPEITDKYMPHLIRGILDGDGCIQAKMYENHFVHKISFCGTYRLMDDISNYIYNKLNLITKPLVYTYKNRNLSEIKVSSIKDMLVLGEWLYKDATIYLMRKKEIYDKFKQHYSL